MHYFSKCVAGPFDDALAVAKQALERQGFAILAHIDVHKALKERLHADFRPYVILSVCSLKLARDALAADEEVGPMMLRNVAVQERDDDCIEISAVDPAATVGTINHVDVIRAAMELRKQLQAVFDQMEASAACDRSLAGRAA